MSNFHKNSCITRKITGLDGKTSIKTLDNNQLNSVANAIRTIEGWQAGTLTSRVPQ
jgi:hypothetical protein